MLFSDICKYFANKMIFLRIFAFFCQVKGEFVVGANAVSINWE